MTNDRRQILTAGLRWLYETVQPNDGLLQHHGASLWSADRRYGFIPEGAARLPVVVVNVRHPVYTGPSYNRVLTNPLRADELADITAELAVLGAEVTGTWNGHPGETGSLGLARAAHPSLIAAVDLYHAGCSEHPRESVFCDCGWYQRGNALIVRPTVNAT